MKRFLASALSILFPNCCAVCGVTTSKLLCGSCLPSLPLIFPSERCTKCFQPLVTTNNLCPLCLDFPLPFRRIRYIWDYEGLIRDVIIAMKFNPSSRLAKWLGEQSASLFSKLNLSCDWDYILYVPASRKTLINRGFNQAKIIADKVYNAHFLSSHTRIIVNGIRITRNKLPQEEIPNEDRFKNVENAFMVHPSLFKQKNILLIDDVLTTGATSGTICSELLKAGAQAVDLFCVSRTSTFILYRRHSYGKFRTSLNE